MWTVCSWDCRALVTEESLLHLGAQLRFEHPDFVLGGAAIWQLI